MPQRISPWVFLLWTVLPQIVRADAPVASYLFPAGGPRGTTVQARLGGLNLHHRPSFEIIGPGVTAVHTLSAIKTVWFEGPIIPMPDSQQAEDYPKDYAVPIEIAKDAPLGARYGRAWTAQGASSALTFIVGDLPEVVEDELDGTAVPVAVKLPVTVNGRIFPREDVDLWSFTARAGEHLTCEVNASRLGSPLDARLEAIDPQGRRIAESDDGLDADPLLHFTAPADGVYQIKIHDINVRGGQAFVYRLTLTSSPYVESTYPLGGRRGTEPSFELIGAGVPTEAIKIALPQDAPADLTQRLSFEGQSTNPFLLAVDDLPETLEAEPNDVPEKAAPIALPGIANGRIGRPGDVDDWSVPLKKGEATEFRIFASRLGSPLSATLTVVDKDGKELARAEGSGPAQPDPTLRFSAPADGTYVIRVADQFRSRGGARYAYRLRVDDRPPAPDFRLRFATDSLTLIRKGSVQLKVDVERIGEFSEPIQLEVLGLPKGVKASKTQISFPPTRIVGSSAPNETSVKRNDAVHLELKLEAEPSAPIGATRLTIRGTAGSIARTATKPAARGCPELDSVLLAVALPTPFKVMADTDFRWAPRGTTHHRRYKIDRGGFQGPLEVRLADRQARHLQGVTGPVLTIPPEVSEFDYPVALPPWMETGRTSRAVVIAVGTVKEADGTEHEVSYSSPQAEVQIIAVIEPSRLAIESERGSLAATPGRSVAIPIHLTRGKGLRGPARVELMMPDHAGGGIETHPIEIAADRSEGVLTIAFKEKPDMANVAAVIRATIMDGVDPVIAETSLAIMAGEDAQTQSGADRSLEK